MNEKKDNMKINIKQVDACKLAIDFEVPTEKIAAETENVFVEIQQNAKPPGFRQGKAPIALIKQKYADTARERVIENLVRTSLFPTLREKNINPIDGGKKRYINLK